MRNEVRTETENGIFWKTTSMVVFGEKPIFHPIFHFQFSFQGTAPTAWESWIPVSWAVQICYLFPFQATKASVVWHFTFSCLYKQEQVEISMKVQSQKILVPLSKKYTIQKSQKSCKWTQVQAQRKLIKLFMMGLPHKRSSTTQEHVPYQKTALVCSVPLQWACCLSPGTA